MISLLRYLHGLVERHNGLPRYEGFDSLLQGILDDTLHNIYVCSTACRFNLIIHRLLSPWQV